MNTNYDDMLMNEHNITAMQLGDSITEMVLNATGVQLDNYQLSDDSVQRCIVNDKSVAVCTSIIDDGNGEFIVTVSSDNIPELKQPISMVADHDFCETYSNMMLTIHLVHECENWLDHALPELRPEDSAIHDTARLNAAPPHITALLNALKHAHPNSGWYKMKYIAPRTKGINACIVVKPTWDTNYTAHILPMYWFDQLRIQEVVPMKIQPDLLVQWYMVETGQKEFVFNYDGKGE